jgi:hypothetical protein
MTIEQRLTAIYAKAKAYAPGDTPAALAYECGLLSGLVRELAALCASPSDCVSVTLDGVPVDVQYEVHEGNLEVHGAFIRGVCIQELLNNRQIELLEERLRERLEPGIADEAFDRARDEALA